jgi:hypothetical protein
MQYLAWPGAVLIFGLVFIIIFRKDISLFFRRVQKIGRDGVQAGSDQIQQIAEKKSSTEELMRVFDSIALRETEANIKADLEKRGFLNDKEVRGKLWGRS